MTISPNRALLSAGCCAIVLSFANNGGSAQVDAAEVPLKAPAVTDVPRKRTTNPAGYRQDVADLRQNYAESMANEQFAEAIVVAKQLVELSVAEQGSTNYDTAFALADLGHAQFQDDDYQAAILNFKASIAMLERVEDNLSANLIGMFSGLGHAQRANGRPDLAVEAYERAVHISNVNYGPLNQKQIDLLEATADALADAGDLKGASSILDRIYQISARKYGAKSIGILPTLQKRAAWSHDHGLFHEEQDLYRQMIRIAADVNGGDDLELMAPLTGLAFSYLYADSTWRLDRRYLSSIASAEGFLKRSLQIARENPDATWRHERDALLAIADFCLFASDFSGARRRYREAWEFLSADEERLASRATHLEQPVRLQLASPPKYVTDQYDKNVPPVILNRRDYRRGYIVAEFDITVEGRSAGVRIVVADPPGLAALENQVVERIERAVYRPRYDHGIPVRSRKLVYRHDFFYLESDLSVESQ